MGVAAALVSDLRTIQIGSASLDPGTLRLHQGEREVRLDPKELGVLLELAARAPAVVPREQLLARVWAGTTVVDNSLDQVIARLRRALGDDARRPSCIETLPRRGYRLMVPVVWPNAGASSAPPTVSFLPLVATGEAELADYAQTASREIANRLAESQSLRVIAHSSPDDGLPRARFIGQGNLRRAGNQIRASVQLSRTDGEVLWSESFDEPLANATPGRFTHALFVARSIEAVVRAAHRADRLPTRSERARRHFFHGFRETQRFASGKGDLSLAVNHYERALAHDPELSDALEQLAFLYATRGASQIRADEALARAHRVLPRLLQLDPDATLSLAFVNHNLDLDYASALVNLDHARCHGFVGIATVELHKALILMKQGRFDEAIERMQAALRTGLGPGELTAQINLADLYWASGRFADALACADRALQSASPNWFEGPVHRIRINHFLGRLDEAKRELDETWARFGATHRAFFPSTLAALGQAELARTILRENDAAWRAGRLHLCSYSFGGHYHLGEYDQAFVWLDRAVENREWWMFPFFRSSLFYEGLRDDPRFARAMRRLAEIEATGSPTKSVATGA